MFNVNSYLRSDFLYRITSNSAVYSSFFHIIYYYISHKRQSIQKIIICFKIISYKIQGVFYEKVFVNCFKLYVFVCV